MKEFEHGTLLRRIFATNSKVIFIGDVYDKEELFWGQKLNAVEIAAYRKDAFEREPMYVRRWSAVWDDGQMLPEHFPDLEMAKESVALKYSEEYAERAQYFSVDVEIKF